jgi:hypothetical protein
VTNPEKQDISFHFLAFVPIFTYADLFLAVLWWAVNIRPVFFIISKGEAHVRPCFQIHLQQDGTVRVL